MRKILVSVLVLVMLSPALVNAQRSQASAATQLQQHKLEIHGWGGYVWTLSKGASYNLQSGDIDIKSSGSWGIGADVNVRPGVQASLLYNRQDSEITFKSLGTTETITDVAVEYYHVGAVGGLPQGNILPFTSLTLGATRFNYKGSSADDEWKFSIILGIGAKAYLNDKLGLRVQGRLPLTFTSGFVGVGTGGVSIGGTGIAQLDVSGGIFLMLG